MAMKSLTLFVLVALAYQPCSSRSMPEEESVVSVYTTQPTTVGTHEPLDVYHQIANNIAERITSPIYRFLGIGKNKTDEEKTTKRTWDKIELLEDSAEETTKPNYLPVDNDISEDREVEELSVEALKKAERKPEKITLYSSYLPVVGKLETLDDKNDTTNEVDGDVDDDDDGFTLDDVARDATPRENYFIYILEFLGSIVQLVWGGLSALFKPSSSSSNSS